MSGQSETGRYSCHRNPQLEQRVVCARPTSSAFLKGLPWKFEPWAANSASSANVIPGLFLSVIPPDAQAAGTDAPIPRAVQSLSCCCRSRAYLASASVDGGQHSNGSDIIRM